MSEIQKGTYMASVVYAEWHLPCCCDKILMIIVYFLLGISPGIKL